MKPAEVALLYERLHDRTPDPETELDFVNNYTLLVAVVLSAQATDASVNLATRDLFKTVNTPAKMLDARVRRDDTTKPTSLVPVPCAMTATDRPRFDTVIAPG